jgi:hypothetical protein
MAFTTTNNIDSAATYLGIQRLPGEINSDFIKRVRKLSAIRYSTDTDRLTKSIINQVGIEYKEAVSIKCKLPYTIKINNQYCEIESFTLTGSNFKRVFIGNISKESDSSTYPLNKVISTLQADTDFTIQILDTNLLISKRENILSISNFKNREYGIFDKCTRLDITGMIPGTLTSSSMHIRSRVDSIPELLQFGDYYFDEKLGYLELFSQTVDQFTIFFKEYQPTFTLLVSDFNLLSPSDYANNGLSDNFINILYLAMEGRGIE